MMKKKFTDFEVQVHTSAGSEYSTVSVSARATSQEGHKKIQDLTYDDISELCAHMGKIIEKKVQKGGY